MLSSKEKCQPSWLDGLNGSFLAHGGMLNDGLGREMQLAQLLAGFVSWLELDHWQHAGRCFGSEMNIELAFKLDHRDRRLFVLLFA